MAENPRPDRPTDRPTDGPIGAAPSRNLGGPSALLGEKVEAEPDAEPDAFVEKRHANGVLEEGERPAAEAWVQSEGRYDRELRRENRAAWYGRHLEQAERHRRTPPTTRLNEREAMNSINNRLRSLEAATRIGPSGGCPECGLSAQTRRPIAVVYPDEPGRGFEGDPYEACTACGEPLYTVIRVLYDSPAGEEGGGASY